MAQKWPRGATLHLRSGGAAKRSYPASKARGGSREELPHAPKPEARGGSWEKQPMPEARGCDERSYPTSEVRGRSREDPMPEGRRPRGVTPCPKSGAAAESARLQLRRNG